MTLPAVGAWRDASIAVLEVKATLADGRGAVRSLEAAQRIRRARTVRETSALARPDLAAGAMRLGLAREAVEDWRGACHAFDEAIATLGAIGRSGSGDFRFDLASALERRASARDRLKRRRAAFTDLLRAFELRCSLLAERQRDPAARRELTYTLLRLGDHVLDDGKAEAALRLYEVVVRARRELARHAPGPARERDLAIARGRYAEARIAAIAQGSSSRRRH